MYVLSFVLVFAFVFPQQNNPTSDEQMRIRQEANRASEEARQQAIQLNELAGHIGSEAEARTIVDAVAKMFEKELPPAWAKRSVRQRIARAEYESAAGSSRLITEQRIANVWNEYVREIDAPEEALITTAEIHNIRDARYVGGQLLWERDVNRSIWTIPNVVAIGPDGKVAYGCRALEAVRLIYELDNMFDNVRNARERVQKGIVVSDELKKRLENPQARENVKQSASLQVGIDTNPLRPAEQRYVREHGFIAFNRLLERLYNQLFPE
jgi:hypothetical protein